MKNLFTIENFENMNTIKKYQNTMEDDNVINEYYDFNGYYHKTTESLKWALYTDDDKEITLVFDENNCLGVEKKEDVRILNAIEDIPDWKEFSIRS